MISVEAKTLVENLMCVTGGDPVEWTTAYENLLEYIRNIEEEVEESRNSDECFNAVIDYILGKGYMESPLEFLRCEMPGVCHCNQSDMKFSFSDKLRPPTSTKNKEKFREFLRNCPQFGNMVVYSKLEKEFVNFLKKLKHDGKLNGIDWYAKEIN